MDQGRRGSCGERPHRHVRTRSISISHQVQGEFKSNPTLAPKLTTISRETGTAKVLLCRSFTARAPSSTSSCNCITRAPLPQLKLTISFRPSEVTFRAVYDGDLEGLPHAGDVVTFVYEGYTSQGEPKQARIIRRRSDIRWSQLLASPDDITKSMPTFSLSLSLFFYYKSFW